MLSIIVPTYNERENIVKLTSSIEATLHGREFELIFVDDSIDDTPVILDEISKNKSYVKYNHRVGERGLATAVMKGFDIAQGDMLAVMDADLQHPPGLLVTMCEAIETGADLVIPSRFIPGGDDGGLNAFRRLVSWTARMLGKLFLKKLKRFSDATGGYFMFRKSVIDGVELNPTGWKILIEIIVKGRYSNVVEVPYKFCQRCSGSSKMSIKEQLNYLRHIIRLVKHSPEDMRLFLFAAVGLSGVLVNLGVYVLLIALDLNVILSGLAAALGAMLSNFILNDLFTWREVNNGNPYSRGVKYFLTSLGGIAISTLLLALLYNLAGLNYILSNLSGIMAGTAWNYVINNIWTWKAKSSNWKIHLERWG